MRRLFLRTFIASAVIFSLMAALNLVPVFAQDESTGAWVDEIIATVEPSAAAAVSRIQANEIDVYLSNVSDPQIYQRILDDPSMGFERAYGSFIELTFNTVGPVFKNGNLNPFAISRIREAMNWLIDREYIAEEIYGGMAVPRFLPINTAFPDYARMAETSRRLELYYEPDPEKAEKIISEEMHSLGATKVGDKWHYNGKPVTIIFLIRNEDERKDLGDYVATLLEDIGFTVDRQYKAAGEASAIWINGDPELGMFHVYTGAWSTAFIERDQGNVFEFYHTGRVLAWPLHQTYKPSPEMDKLSSRLYRNDFTTLEEREELFSRALELSMQESNRIWLADLFVINPRVADISVSADLASGMQGTFLWPHTLRYGDQKGGTVNLAGQDLLAEPWNPLDGSNWVYDQTLIRATIDSGVFPDPYTGLFLPQRIEKAEVTIKEGLPISQTLDWVNLEFAKEIPVPGDVWIDWDASKQRFITAAEKYPDGITANSKNVVTYPADLFDITWHDGSKLSLGDFVMGMILTFDRGKEDSPFFDPSKAAMVESALQSFRGVRIVSTNPLVIETYTDEYTLDVEANISTWFPTYSFGPGGWHTLALGLRAEAAGEAAFTNHKATTLEVEHLNYVSGPTLGILAKHLGQARNESYVPYANTLRQYVSALEIAERWRNLAHWYESKGHFWVGTGPFYLERAFPVEKIIHLRRNDAYPDPSDKWERFQSPMIAEIELSGPPRVRLGSGAEFRVEITFDGETYPVEYIHEVKYMLFDATRQLVHSGNAKPNADGTWQVQLSPRETRLLSVGSNRLEVVVSSRVVSIPFFESILFVSTP